MTMKTKYKITILKILSPTLRLTKTPLNFTATLSLCSNNEIKYLLLQRLFFDFLDVTFYVVLWTVIQGKPFNIGIADIRCLHCLFNLPHEPLSGCAVWPVECLIDEDVKCGSIYNSVQKKLHC